MGFGDACPDAKEAVLHALAGLDIDLGRQVAFRINLFVHRQRGVLAVAKTLFGVGLEHTLGESFRIVETSPDLLALLGVDDRGAGVLAERELPFRGHLGIAKEAQGHVFVVVGGVRIAQDLSNLPVVRRPQQEVDITERNVRQQRQSLRIHPQDGFPFEFADGHIFARELVVFSLIRSQLEHRRVFEFHHIVGISYIVSTESLRLPAACPSYKYTHISRKRSVENAGDCVSLP